MSLYCNDGERAEITPWVPLPPLARGENRGPLEPERDRCQRTVCRRLAWQHWTLHPSRWP